ncbi:glutathione S-transferase family protein [Albidovulum sediminicola]|uniref:glutathione transferase n=1 Tax=Albidovulum sediminicola TaxID=2984331 RepID=A0ABT2Z6E2_9RHOB|nr:glutathione S-transferase family protein [Defluviimonas sp. WL0075]MCV2866645.1 glutathione S-transferase family protein [Defluviimonas sp. WL0075]
MPTPMTLVSHALCPYVQRIAIALDEKGLTYERRTVDLSNKPAWFLELSPLGRTPVLQVGETALFESSAILEFLEDTQPHPLHPSDPIERALHRAWIDFGAECLRDIAAFYSATDHAALDMKAAALHARFRLLEMHLGAGRWFGGDRFSLVDAVYAPVFRYFDSFDRIGNFGVLDGLERVRAWRANLADRPSVRRAVGPEYDSALADFLTRRGGLLSRLAEQARFAQAS